MVIKGRRNGGGKQELRINIDTLLYVIDNKDLFYSKGTLVNIL